MVRDPLAKTPARARAAMNDLESKRIEKTVAAFAASSARSPSCPG